MRFIPTKVHGLLDYLMGAFLAISPWVFQFNGGGAKQWIPILLGVAMIIMSLCTNYEWGAARTVPMRTHLMIDLMSGIFLAVSPWLFGFADEVYLPHLVLGILEVGAALLTKTEPSKHGMLGPGTI
jgi:hypothetical protein